MKKIEFNLNSIKTRLIILVFSVILLDMLIQIFFVNLQIRHGITTLASVQLETMANYVANDINNDIVYRRQFLERLAEQFSPELLDDPASLQHWLKVRHEINPLFSKGLSVIDRSGIVVADYPVLPDRVDQSFADRDYFQRAMQGHANIGRPILGRISNTPVLPMAMPLSNEHGVVYAVLVGISELRSPDFLEALYDTRFGERGGLILVSPHDHLFIGASHRDIALRPVPAPGLHRQHDLAMQGFRGVGIDVNAKGVEELAAVAQVPSSGWFLVARLPTSEVFAPIAHLVQLTLKTTIALVFVFLVVIVIGLRYQLRPLINAARHAEQMTEGRIPLQPLPVIRNDEVGYLTTAFNQVLAKLLESRAALEQLAHHDVLTGLPNRQLLADRFQQACNHAQRKQTLIVLLFLDLDGFKLINDRLGHGFGDAALIHIAQRLRQIVRREDTLARVGGDEFVILLSDIPADDQAKSIAERVAEQCLSVFQEPLILQGESCHLGVSIGIAQSQGEHTLDDLTTHADQAMYRAKQAGRGCFVWAE